MSPQPKYRVTTVSRVEQQFGEGVFAYWETVGYYTEAELGALAIAFEEAK